MFSLPESTGAGLLRHHLIATIVLAVCLVSCDRNSVSAESSPPELQGRHFRITAVEEGWFLRITDRAGGGLDFSGYLIDMLQAIAIPSRGNFTFELRTPSGLGTACNPQVSDKSANLDRMYAADYRTQYNCGANDVYEVTNANASTDMYLGMFYVSTERQLVSRFTMPFAPPYKGTPAMVGTTTGVRDISELAERQSKGLEPPVCIGGSTALLDFVQNSFPSLTIQPFYGDEDDRYRVIRNGECPVHIMDAPLGAQFVLRRASEGNCLSEKEEVCLVRLFCTVAMIAASQTTVAATADWTDWQANGIRFIALRHWHAQRHARRRSGYAQLLDRLSHVV